MQRYIVGGVDTASEKGKVWLSDDIGRTWSIVDVGVDGAPNRVKGFEAFIENFLTIYCSSGESNLVYSVDAGESWGIVENAPGNWVGAAHGGGITVVIADDGRYIYGENVYFNGWTEILTISNSGEASLCTDITYGEGGFVVTWQSGHISYIVDGDIANPNAWITLKSSTSSQVSSTSDAPFGIDSSEYTCSINSIIHDGSNFVIIGKDGKIATANDPASWTLIRSGEADLKRITTKGSSYVVTSATNYDYWTTEDLVTFTPGRFAFGTATAFEGTGVIPYQVDIASGNNTNYIAVTPVDSGSGLSIFNYNIPTSSTEIPYETDPCSIEKCRIRSGPYTGSYIGACVSHTGPFYTAECYNGDLAPPP